GAPLQVRGKTLGVITFIAAESGHRYGPAELRLAEDLAQRAAIAVENARLYSELREADRRKDEFLAMLAHELRNHLAPIRNALRHSAAKVSRRAGRVWLSAEAGGDDVVLRVKDEGAGIPAELLPQIFDLFVQADNSLERSQGGLGIGLTVVRRLVEMHGGTVTAASAGLRKGSEFVVRLPLVGQPARHDGAERAGELATVTSRCRILVVDD